MSDSIQVAIKVRPLIKREKDENLPVQWTVLDNTIVPTDPEKKRGESVFLFDHIFDPEKSNANVFETVVRPIVDAAVKGFNGTVFAYGQTSSGKTHTMLGTPSEPGVIPMAVERTFDSIAETAGREFLLRVSYLEIYNEKVNDLLDTSGLDLKLREDSNGLVQVLKSKEEIASSPDIIMNIMRKGDKNRRIGETDMNERSSRSHTIFRITIESREQSEDSDGAIQVSQLNLVDLAGSERARQTNATGERFKEGTHINMSLSTLGLVIKQLSESDNGTKYVNFRDSKLTRLLQASLGGNAMTTIICAVTPAAYEETQCTLSFASRAKSVKNKPQLNEVMSEAALLKRYKKQLSKLNEELERLRSDNRIAEVEEMESKLQEKEHKLQETDRQNQLLEERIELLKNSIVSAGSATKDDNSKNVKSKRRRTWAGDRGLNFRYSLHPTNLPPIREIPCFTPEAVGEKSEKKNMKSRKSIIQIVDFNNESFETAFTDFELELIKVAKEREEQTDVTIDTTVDKYISSRINSRSNNRVQFIDEVEVHRFSNCSNWSEFSTPEKQKFLHAQGDRTQESCASPGTPKSVLRERLNYITEEYTTLQEFTTLERQMLSAQQAEVGPSNEKIFMQQQIDGLLERLGKYSTYQNELEEQMQISVDCIKELSLRSPDILETWKPSFFYIEKGESDIISELRQLQEILKLLKNEKSNSEKALTPLEKKLTNDYNECLKELNQVQSQKDLLFKENTEMKKRLMDEANRLKDTEIQINTLKNDTDCLMEKLLEKNSELSKLKEKVVELERITNEVDNVNTNMLETSVNNGKFIEPVRADASSRTDIINETNQDVNPQLLQLNEIIEEKTQEIIKYRQLEEKMKLENERLQQSLDSFSKAEKNVLNIECQTDEFSRYELQNEKETEIEVIKQKDIEILKLLKSLEEKTDCITNYQENQIVMEEKMKNLQNSLNALSGTEKISNIHESDDVLSCCKTEINPPINYKQEISKLSGIINEMSSEITNYKKIEQNLKSEIEKLNGENNPERAMMKSVSCQTLYFSDPGKHIEARHDLDQDAEISRLEAIIQDKTLEISKYVIFKEESTKKVEYLQLCLENLNKTPVTTQGNQTENVTCECLEKSVMTDIEDTSNEMSELLELIKLKSNEIENYKRTQEEMREEINQLQQNKESKKQFEEVSSKNKNEKLFKKVDENMEIDEIDQNMKVDDYSKYLSIIKQKDLEIEMHKQTIEEMQSEIAELHHLTNEINSLQQVQDEVSRLSTIIEEKTREIEEANKVEEKMRKEIDYLQVHSAPTPLIKSTKQCESQSLVDKENLNKLEDNITMNDRISELMDIIAMKENEIMHFKHSEHLQQSLESVKNNQQISQECQTECISDIKEKDFEIFKLTGIINEQISKIAHYKELEEDTKREIELLRNALADATNKIEIDQHKPETLKECAEILEEKSVTGNTTLEIKITSLEDELSTKLKNIEQLNLLNQELKNGIDEKTDEMSNLQQTCDNKVMELEEQMNVVILERDKLKDSVNSKYPDDIAKYFNEEVVNIEDIVYRLKEENEILKKRVQEYAEKYHVTNSSPVKKENKSSNIIKLETDILVDEPMNSSNFQPKEVEQSVTLTVAEEKNKVSSSETSLAEQMSTLKNKSQDSSNIPLEFKRPDTCIDGKNFVKPLSKKLESETSSIFANMTYFDNMEVGQSFVQECTSLSTSVLDESRDISSLVKNNNSMSNLVGVTKSELENTDSVFLNDSRDVSKCSNVQPLTNADVKDNIQTIEELEKVKATLEKENMRLNHELQKKILEVDDIQGVVRDFKQNLEILQQTIYQLTNENMDMSKHLTDAREDNNHVAINLQKEIDTLTIRLSQVSDEKIALKNELAVLSEQFDIVRSRTPVITDDETRNKILEYQEKIKMLTDENIDLSTNLMDKIEELERVKESKVQQYDHECIHKERSHELHEKLQYLENENIELSNGLTEHIEECDKLRETVNVLKQQLEIFTHQKSTENSSESDLNNLELLRQENSRLTSEMIEFRAKMTQLERENINLSANLDLDNIGEHKESCDSSRSKILDVSETPPEISSIQESPNGSDDVSSLNQRIKNLQEQVDHLTLLNKKLSALKLTNCSQCAHLKELNESRRQLKLEVKSLNQKLFDLQKKFEQKCADTDILRMKANEDLNASLSAMELTFNGSLCDGLNVTVVEGKVQHLYNEIEELKENHNKLSNQYKEKCNELEKLQFDNNVFASASKPLKENQPRKNSQRVQALEKNIDKTNADLQELKKYFANVNGSLQKFISEKKDYVQEITSLKMLNEELKNESSTAQANVLNYEEKIKLLEEELASLYSQIETANVSEKNIQSQKMELEVQLESLLKEKSELANSLQETEVKFRKEIEDKSTRIDDYEKENADLKSELQRVENIVQQLKMKNVNYMEDELKDEINFAKSRILKEIKGLTSLSEDELKVLPKKSVTDVFIHFLNTILSKEQEMVKKLQEDFERSKRKLMEEIQQCIDSEKRANAWSKTLETDLEKWQNDCAEHEHKNKRYQDQVHKLEEKLKEALYENQQLHSNIVNLESDLNSLHNELDKKSKSENDRDSVISAAQERERIVRNNDEEWENRLKFEKERHAQEVENLKSELESCKSMNDDLRNTVEGLDLEIEHLKNTIDSKTNDHAISLRQMEELQKEIGHMEEIIQHMKSESLENKSHIDDITGLLKVKCDLLTEYKTKVETMNPEFESLQAQIAERKMTIEKYKEEIHNLRLENNKQLDALQDKLSEEKIKTTGLNKQLVEMKNKNTTLSCTIVEMTDRIAEIERKNEILERKVRNSTSKVRVESEIQELQDENRSLKNHLEGSYNRIKELQESRSQVQRDLTEVQGKNELLEQELHTTKHALVSLREKYNNTNLQNLREKYDELYREKNCIIREVEEKKMHIASKDQKLVEYSIEIDTLKKQNENLKKDIKNVKNEKTSLETKVSDLIRNNEKLKEKIEVSNVETEKAYNLVTEEKNKISFELENCKKEVSELQCKNKELNEEMDELVNHIHQQTNEIDELQDRLITGTFNKGHMDKLKALEDDYEKLKIDSRITELNRKKLQNEVIRLNSEKEMLQGRIEDLNNRIGELESKNSSRNSSKSNSPTTQKGRRRSRRSDVYNRNRNLDDDSKNTTDTDSPSITPTPPPIVTIQEECRTCSELKNRIREISVDLVSKNGRITMLELQLQKQNFPYQIKCNELQESLLACKTRNSEMKLEIQKLQRALMGDSSRECHVCRMKKLNKRDQGVQVNLENKIALTGMSSGIVEDYIKLQKMEKERNIMKNLCRERSRKIKELEQRLRELEGSQAT